MEIVVNERNQGAGVPRQYRDTPQGVSPFDPLAVPYTSILSFEVLIREIVRLKETGDSGTRFLANAILERLEDTPQLRGPIRDLTLLDQHREIVDLLMLFVTSPVDRSSQLFKVCLPFHFEPLLTSQSLLRMMGKQDVCYTFSEKAGEVLQKHLITIGCIILQQCYGVDVDINVHVMLTVPDPATGLKRFYKPLLNEDYAEVVVEGELPDLSEADIRRLLNNLHDTDLWLKMLPPDRFSFQGFSLAHLYEVTEEESLSRLKHRLISRDAVLDVERVKELANLVRLHFQRPHLQLGLTAVDYPIERAIDHEYRIRYNLLSDEVDRLTDRNYAGSIYDQVFRSGEMMVIQDLRDLPTTTFLEDKLIDLGYRSMLLAPLLSQEKNVIGLVELASPVPYALNAFMERKFEEIRGLFRTAVERSREYIDNLIEVIMREQFTSLHPTVEWRFTEAAFNILKRQEEGLPQINEEIRFKKVFPLYGQADIVGSSNLRNAAIYQDLIDNLRAGRLFLVRALDLAVFPIIDQVIMTLDTHLATTLGDFDNSHEIRIGDFIQKQLTPLVRQLGQQLPELRDLYQQYEDQLSPDLGLFYRVRRDYEQSVHSLNRLISDFLTERNQAAQRILPHYFEKYKTDGVEYEIYAGQSLLKRQKFSNIHLKNLRLSQLVDLCDLTRRVAEHSATLPMPLRTAQLVFAYTSPLNIRFRMDEKRFDVDGDYNVRYEILKKRIDKATIHQGSERLTQPGMVSIVYLQDRDREEYDDYLRYLHQAGYIDGEIEYLVLDPLQSVNGLRALRFRVRT
ncbi:GAF domain-containing protein [Lewinella marina]|uniref:GAF domain-containing protein n=1 Tax=Neolewinella marina TaxID=438751 RepID=UPI00142F5CD2|nr:GAF domain-containing protein [Neolewinella marina]NJB84262.1 GAF domain-containing protein [Neolewinella marina]